MVSHEAAKVWCNIDSIIVLVCFSDELSALLRKLSLEKYAPIFEEQEVRLLFVELFFLQYFLIERRTNSFK